MDAINALGYSMLFAQNNNELEQMYREYHSHVQLILWEASPWHSGPCLQNSTCVYTDTQTLAPAPPPNSTHLNIPIWYVAPVNYS